MEQVTPVHETLTLQQTQYISWKVLQPLPESEDQLSELEAFICSTYCPPPTYDSVALEGLFDELLEALPITGDLICGVVAIKNQDECRKSSGVIKGVKCAECRVTFATVGGVRNHMRRMHKEVQVPRRLFRCVKCKIAFASEVLKRNHVKSTHGGRVRQSNNFSTV